MPTALLQGWDLLLESADALRGRLLAWFGRPFRSLLVDRQARVALYGSGLIAVAGAWATTWPLWMLALAPFVWGVPHLLADVRYLVVRQGLHRERLLGPLLLASLVAGLVLGVRGTLLGAVTVTLACPGTLPRKLAWTLGLSMLAALAWWAGPTGDVVLAHAHNLVAVGLWLAWRSRTRAWHWLPLGVFTAGAVWLLLGNVTEVLDRTGGLQPPVEALSLDDLAWQLAPVADPDLALRLVLLYGFAQGAHYVMWIHLLPTEDRARPVPRSFRRSWRALRADLGPWLPALALVVAVALAGWAVADLVAARLGYFQLAWFHGHLELLVTPLLALRGIRTAAAPAR